MKPGIEKTITVLIILGLLLIGCYNILVYSAEQVNGAWADAVGSELQVKWAIEDYNDSVENYRITVQIFPINLVATMTGFDVNTYNYYDPGACASAIVD